MLDRLGENEQLIFTTHNTDMLDLTYQSIYVFKKTAPIWTALFYRRETSMTIYLKDGSIENCLSDEHKSEFWEDLIERRLGRDALTFYQDDIQTEAKEALEEQLSDLQLKLVHASEHLEESLWQIGTAKSMSRKCITDLLNEANRLLTEISQQIDKVIY